MLTSSLNSIGGSGVQIAEAAQRATIAFKHAEEQFKELKELTQLLKYSLMTRRERWRMFQKFITARAKTQFTYLVSERGYKGRLISNHKERKLDIQVDPKGDANKPKNGNKGGGSGVPTTQGLSGGEKSFTTICLLLSLWEAMGAPIRCLDEFDVFMDSVNRTVSVEMMIKAARRNVGKQFIFITPGSMDAVPQDKDVKVTKMRDPERGLQPIRFPAQPQNGAVEVM